MTILDLLQRYAVDYATHHKGKSRSGWVQVLQCPFCGASGYYLGFQLDGQRAACWMCGGKNAAKALKAVTGAPWPEVLAVTKHSGPVIREATVYGGYKPPSNTGPLELCHTRYLKRKRKLDSDYCAAVWKLLGTGPISNHPFRIILPVYKPGRQPLAVSWTARAIADDADIRYITAQDHEKAYNEKDLLYGAEHARTSIIAVEGPFGAIRLGKGAVATLGLTYSVRQVLLMSTYARRVICFDNEPQAQARADKLCQQLSLLPGETIRVNLDSADPGEATNREREQIRKLAFGRIDEW